MRTTSTTLQVKKADTCQTISSLDIRTPPLRQIHVHIVVECFKLIKKLRAENEEIGLMNFAFHTNDAASRKYEASGLENVRGIRCIMKKLMSFESGFIFKKLD